jgi:ADP-heptose:LPS heptosyltransferase
MRTIFIQYARFGDVIWTEPIVRYFLERGEQVNIHTKHSCVFDNYPNSQLSINAEPQSFPTIFSFQNMPKMHYLDGLCDHFGIQDLKPSYPQLHLSLQEKKRKVQGDYAIFHLDRYVKSELYRNVYGVNWNEVVDYVRSKGLIPIQISKEGKNLIADWLPTKDFREVMSLLYHSRLFIGLDSGPSHIAASFGIPSVIFFGSVNPAYRHFSPEKKIFLQNPCPYAHCYHTIPLGPPCRLVQKGAPPPCCQQDASRVIHAINMLRDLL